MEKMNKLSGIVKFMAAIAVSMCLGCIQLIAQTPDSLNTANNMLSTEMDSVATEGKDSTKTVTYSKRELKRMHRDSIWNYKDSVIRHTPRLLSTYVFDDTTKYKRMFLWNADTYFNKPVTINPDTTMQEWYSEQPHSRYDAGANYLGISGSAMMYNNWFLRPDFKIFPFFEYYLPYSYTPETLPFYNTKTPYTEMGYWGTLFANKMMEESNVKFLHTQNFTPAFNFNFLYRRYGGAGMLEREKTDNRTVAITGNYLGKRYLAQGGYIFNRIKREENGGISDPSMVLDTLVDAKVIPITLKDANTVLKRNTFFLTQSYGIPFKFLQKRDTLGKREEQELGEGTMAYIGHSFDASFYSKKYTDNIPLTDSIGRALYHNKFYINPTESADSMRVFQLENRFFINLQPWAKEAIVSNVSAGIGHQYLSLYGFKQDFFLHGNSTEKQNNMYMYFGAGGKLKKYFNWTGKAQYHFAGYYQNDFAIDGQMTFSSYPKKMPQGIHLTGKINLALERPNYFFNNAYTNHYVWNNNFEKTTKTEIQGRLYIPNWKMEASVGYAMLKDNTYFDSLSIVRQNPEAMSILSAYVKKDIKLGKLHFENKVLFQVSSNEEVVPLPELALDLRYYFQFWLVKKVLEVQVGANAIYTSEYYAPGYSPALGVFYNQKTEKIGNTPYVDAFINMQWKRASIFIKYINAAQGWPDNDYFSAFRYIRSQKALKFGIHWPFYAK